MLTFRTPLLVVLGFGQAVAEELQVIRQADGGQKLRLRVLGLLLGAQLGRVWELKIHQVCRVLLGQTQALDIFYNNVQLEDLVAVRPLVRVH
jgi:hypothetical protein